MSTARCTTQILRTAAVFSLSFPFAAFAEVSIRLGDLPDRLSFPLPEGVNRILTATIKGGEVKSVWLAATDTQPSSRRVALIKVDEGEYAINLAAREVYDLLSGYEATSQFRIFAETVEGTTVRSIAVRYTMRVVPERLDFPFDEAKMTICQRSSKRLPGSDGALRVHLDDITFGQVLVTVYGPRGEPIVDTVSLREGDTLPLPLDGQDYVLHVDKLVNFLIGNDYGVFTLMARHAWEAKKVDALLEVITNADATFIRNDQELSAKAFAAHLRRKAVYFRHESGSLADFIEKVASRSSETDKPYRVKLPNGEIFDANTWLWQQAADMERERNVECQLDMEAYDRFLDILEKSEVTFTDGCSDPIGVLVGWRDLVMSSSDATGPCADMLVESLAELLETWEDTCQAKFRDGHSVPAAAWLREQASEAAR